MAAPQSELINKQLAVRPSDLIVPMKQIYAISINQCNNLLTAAQHLKTLCSYIELIGISFFGGDFGSSHDGQDGHGQMITAMQIMQQLASLMTKPAFNEEFIYPLLSTTKLFCDFIQQQPIASDFNNSEKNTQN